jgi:hypothetical protein
MPKRCWIGSGLYGAPANCAAASTPATCHGTFDAVCFVVDWQFAKKFDTYAGVMFSQVNGGLASGFLHRNSSLPPLGFVSASEKPAGGANDPDS